MLVDKGIIGPKNLETTETDLKFSLSGLDKCYRI